jgi:hypothetical protein
MGDSTAAYELNAKWLDAIKNAVKLAINEQQDEQFAAAGVSRGDYIEKIKADMSASEPDPYRTPEITMPEPTAEEMAVAMENARIYREAARVTAINDHAETLFNAMAIQSEVMFSLGDSDTKARPVEEIAKRAMVMARAFAAATDPVHADPCFVGDYFPIRRKKKAL